MGTKDTVRIELMPTTGFDRDKVSSDIAPAVVVARNVVPLVSSKT